MSLILTEDGNIFPYNGNDLDTDYIYEKYGELRSSPIIKKANTLEELCDTYVIVEKGRYTLTKINFISLNKNRKIYGAVWTKWGLKFIGIKNLDTQMLDPIW